VSRPLQTLASLVVLGVLAGAPAAAVVCAELCAPERQSASPDHAAHHPPLSPQDVPAAGGDTGAPATDCHGAAAVDGVALRADAAARCADSAPGTLPSVGASRQDSGQALALLPAAGSATLTPLPLALHRARARTLRRPARPAASSPVLRI
jgi:hypothetical protein